MAVRHRMLGEPHLQGAGEAARGMLDEMRQPIVGNRLLPVAQDLRGWLARAARERLTTSAPDLLPATANAACNSTAHAEIASSCLEG